MQFCPLLDKKNVDQDPAFNDIFQISPEWRLFFLSQLWRIIKNSFLFRGFNLNNWLAFFIKNQENELKKIKKFNFFLKKILLFNYYKIIKRINYFYKKILFFLFMVLN